MSHFSRIFQVKDTILYPYVPIKFVKRISDKRLRTAVAHLRV